MFKKFEVTIFQGGVTPGAVVIIVLELQVSVVIYNALATFTNRRAFMVCYGNFPRLTVYCCPYCCFATRAVEDPHVVILAVYSIIFFKILGTPATICNLVINPRWRYM